MAKLVLFFANRCTYSGKTYLHKPCGAKTFVASTTIYYFCSQNNNKNNRNMERLFFFRDCRCVSIRRWLPGKKQKDWFRMGFWYLTHQCGDWSHCRIVL